jgi:hypothetical protein
MFLTSTTTLRPAPRAAPAWQALSLLAALLGPASAIGQEAGQAAGPAASDTSRVSSVVSQLEPDTRLRFEVAETGTRLEGRFVRSEGGSLVVRGGVDEHSAPLVDIERLWTRGRSTWQGAWIGAIGGLVLGVFYGVAISEVACAESSCTTGLAAATGGIGAAGGAALGALVGLAIPRWKLRFHDEPRAIE